MRIYSCIAGVCALLVCTGFGQSPKDTSNGQSSLQIYGQLIDAGNNRYEVDSITISGKRERIKTFTKPVDPSHDPAEHITYINLVQVTSIEPAASETRALISRFRHRAYREIVVTLRDGSTMQLLIDYHQKIRCNHITNAGPIEKELTFDGLKKLIITGSYRRCGDTTIEKPLLQ